MSLGRSRPYWTSTVLAVLLAAAVMLPVLGHRTLTAWDEAIYAEVSREMLGRSWLVPYWNGQPWFEKPPLMMWVTTVFFRVFAVDEFWARAGSAFSGIAIVGLLHSWIERRRDRLTAWLSTAILLSTFGYLHAGSTGELDLMLSLGCVVALIGLAEVDEEQSWGWYLFWVGFAFAAMTKGAAAVVLLLMLGVFWLVRAGTVRRSFWFGLGLFLAAVLPWHCFMVHRFGMAFVREYLGFHVVARATEQIEGHITPWWFYGKVLLADAAPWVMLYPFAIAAALRRPGRRVFAVFAVVVLVFFSVVQTRLAQYIVPVYAVLAWLTADFVADWLHRIEFAAKTLVYRAATVAIVALLCTASALLTISPRRQLHVAKLANGIVVPRDRESVALLREVMPREQAVGGPVLLWREMGGQSIAPDVFYAGRPVQQVQMGPVDAGAVVRYTYDPKPVDGLAGSDERLIMLDRSLVSVLPIDLFYRRIEAGPTLEIGLIGRAPQVP